MSYTVLVHKIWVPNPLPPPPLKRRPVQPPPRPLQRVHLLIGHVCTCAICRGGGLLFARSLAAIQCGSQSMRLVIRNLAVLLATLCGVVFLGRTTRHSLAALAPVRTPSAPGVDGRIRRDLPLCPSPSAQKWRHKTKSQCAGRGQSPVARLQDHRVSVTANCSQPPYWHPCLRPAERHDISERVLQDECIAVVCPDVRTTYLTQVLPSDAADDAWDAQGGAAFSVVSLLVDSVSVAHFHRDVFNRTQAFVRRLRADPRFLVTEFCNLRVVGVGSAHNQGAAYRHTNWNTTVFRDFRDAGYAVGTSVAPSRNNQEQHLNGPVAVGAHHDLLAGLPPTVAWKSANAPKCFGDKYYDDLSLAYTRQLARRYRDKALAVFGYTSLPHSPDMSYSHQLDAPLADTLTEFLESGLLHRSVLVLWSDHGLSYGGYFRGAQGKREHRNPFLLIAVPEAFARAYPEHALNLQRNQHARLTHFDLHATLRHMASLGLATPPAPPRPRRPHPHPKACLSDAEFAQELDRYALGYSLLDEVPAARSCSDMGIRCKFCDAVAHEDVSANATAFVQPPIRAFLQEVNANISGLQLRDVCASLALGRVEKVTRVEGIYTVAFATESSPGRGALWEVSVERAARGYAWHEPKRISTYAIDEIHCPSLTSMHHMYCVCLHVPPNYADPMLKGDRRRRHRDKHNAAADTHA